MSGRRNGIWWFGIPVLAGLLSWGPYWAWNIVGGAVPANGWWRVPVVTSGLFDTYVYLHWMGAAALGLPYGGHLKWFGAILKLLWSVIGSWASIPELWIISRWITFTLTFWIAAWAFERWGGLGRMKARFLSLSFFAAVVLTLGLRPGVYAWYLPFCIFGLVLVWFTDRALRRGTWVTAAVWSVLAVALTWIYPWFFMTAGLWLCVLWGMWLARLRRWAMPAALGTLGVAVCVGSVALARWFLAPAQAGLIGEYERNGMAFAHVPFLANTILAMLGWVALLMPLARRTITDVRQRMVFMVTGWITIFALWFHTPFTGIHTYSDHLIAPTTVLAWMTLAIIWNWAQAPLEKMDDPSRIMRWLPWGVTIGATVFVLYVLQQPLRMNVFKFDSYVIHLAHWLALAAAGWIALWRLKHPSSAMPNRTIVAAVGVSALSIGIGGIVPAFVRDLPSVRSVADKSIVTQWVMSHVPSTTSICADPETASFYAGHTGRRVNPAEATLSWPDSSEQVIQNLITLVGAYDVKKSGSVDMYQFYTDHYRTIPCTDESKYSHNAPYANVLHAFGFAPQQINDLIGCDEQTLRRNRARVGAAIDAHHLDVSAFRSFCSSVIIPQEQKAFWTLPSDYVEHKITPDVSLWQTP